MDAPQIEYYEAVEGLDEYGSLVCSLIKELLADAGIQIHSITYRIKDVESVLRKLSLKTKYASIAELTDLLGVRIVTYFPNDVDKVANVIQREFLIDEENSVDKRNKLHPNEFGYLSLHFVAGISKDRLKLTEYKRYKGKTFELQIRSILQHAWAEIEHDLGYKAKNGLPTPLKRRFFRLAGLLELADEEFEHLRQDITNYEEEVDKEIKTAPERLPIDQSTLVSSYEHEPALNELDRQVASAWETTLRPTIDPSYMATEADSIKALGIDNISQLHAYAKAYKDHVGLFAKLWTKRSAQAREAHSTIVRGTGLFFLAYTLAAQKDPVELKHWGYHISGRHHDLLDRIKATWEEVIKELGQPPKIH